MAPSQLSRSSGPLSGHHLSFVERKGIALWHVPGGYAMRAVLGETKAIVASAKKVGGLGARLDVPVTHINASYVRSHFDAMEVRVQMARVPTRWRWCWS